MIDYHTSKRVEHRCEELKNMLVRSNEGRMRLVDQVVSQTCRDISIEIDDGSAMVNAMGAQKAKDYKCLG
jgi:hypothetical protein